MDTDHHLVTRARHGDDLAFGELVQRHQFKMHRTASAILGSSIDAEDIVQDAWLHAYMHLSRFRGTASFTTWMHAIVRNLAIDHNRAVRRRPWNTEAHATVMSPSAEVCGTAASPEQLMFASERRRQLATAIAALPGRLRDMLHLWCTGQYSYKAMAQIADISIGTAKSRVWEARQRLMHMTSTP